MKKLNKILPIILLFTMLLSGCGKGSATESSNMKDFNGMTYDTMAVDNISTSYTASAGAYNESYEYADEADYDAPQEATNEVNNEMGGAKLIRRVDISIETKEFDKLIENINQKMTSLGGWVQDSSLYNNDGYNPYRNQYITIRLPYEKVDAFLDDIDAHGTIRNISDNTEDITLKYANTQTRLDNLNVQHQRLLELLSQAERIEDIIVLEERLSEVETEIDSYQIEIKNYDNLVNYSTITLNINESIYIQNEPETFGERIWNELSYNLHNIKENFADGIIYFIAHIPNIVILGMVIFIVYKIVKKVKLKIKKKKERKEEEN